MKCSKIYSTFTQTQSLNQHDVSELGESGLLKCNSRIILTLDPSTKEKIKIK